ncbi:PsbP domain-containing protein, partial [Haematococcus lacustris]
PVRVASIEEFGGLDSVGSALLEAERKKESTLGVSLLTSIERLSPGSSGARLYEYEYELDSTRGRKRVINTVTIHKARLRASGGGAGNVPHRRACAGGEPELCSAPQAAQGPGGRPPPGRSHRGRTGHAAAEAHPALQGWQCGETWHQWWAAQARQHWLGACKLLTDLADDTMACLAVGWG